MSPLEHETTQSAHDLTREYQAYLDRFQATAETPRPLSEAEFQAVLDRWQREYHGAWRANDTANRRELEHLVAL